MSSELRNKARSTTREAEKEFEDSTWKEKADNMGDVVKEIFVFEVRGR